MSTETIVTCHYCKRAILRRHDEKIGHYLRRKYCDPYCRRKFVEKNGKPSNQKRDAAMDMIFSPRVEEMAKRYESGLPLREPADEYLQTERGPTCRAEVEEGVVVE